MRKFAFIIPLLLIAACAGTPPQPAQHVRLKDGSHLFIQKDGTMRMTDPAGAPKGMKDGVEMETADGAVLVMKNFRMWRKVPGSKPPVFEPF